MTWSKFTTGKPPDEREQRCEQKTKKKKKEKKILSERAAQDVWSSILGEKDDSHFTESGPSVKCYNQLELLFPRRALLPDFEIFCLNKRCTFDLCASHVED